MPRPRKPAHPSRYFHSSPEVIRRVLLMSVRFPLSLRNVEDLLFERGIDICHETVRLLASTSGAPSRSWISAVWTTAPTRKPWVSVRMWRFLPLIFLPAS